MVNSVAERRQLCTSLIAHMADSAAGNTHSKILLRRLAAWHLQTGSIRTSQRSTTYPVHRAGTQRTSLTALCDIPHACSRHPLTHDDGG